MRSDTQTGKSEEAPTMITMILYLPQPTAAAAASDWNEAVHRTPGFWHELCFAKTASDVSIPLDKAHATIRLFAG